MVPPDWDREPIRLEKVSGYLPPLDGVIKKDLRSIRVFHGLNLAQLTRVAQYVKKVAVPARIPLFRQGESGGALYFILSGAVDIMRLDDDADHERHVVRLKAGQSFGETVLVDDAPRAASAVMAESGLLLMLTREDWEQLVFVDRDAGYHVLWTLVRMLATRLREVEPESLPIVSNPRYVP